jgi:NADPH:quinone reductase-like Zn-dependent oxidoreductase
MRAALIEDCGRPPVLAAHPEPVPGPGWARVRVLAAPVTPLDLLCASGTSYFGTPALPYVPGVQGVGTAGGRLVWFPTSAGMAPGNGSMAEVALVRAGDLVELPPGVDPVAMAALGLSAVAAYLALTWRGELAAGEQVLVLGVGGVVGQAAVQLARIAGARRVVAAARSAAGRARAKQAGADAVVSLDTNDPEDTADSGNAGSAGRAGSASAADRLDVLVARLAAACDGPVDLVLDPLFGIPAAAAARLLRPSGRLVNLGGSAGESAGQASGRLVVTPQPST